MKGNPILLEITRLLLAPILLFALYVQFHGDFGPGGGFQAGVIFAAGIVLYALIHGVEATRRVLPPRVVQVFVAAGLLLYAGTGMVSVIAGGHYLDYNRLADNPLAGQHWGVFLVELGVGVTVAAVMITIFYAFAGFRR